MSQFLFDEYVRRDNLAVVIPNSATSWSEMRGCAQSILDKYSYLEKRRIGLSFAGLANSYAALAAFSRLQCDVFLLDDSLEQERALQYCRKFRLGALLVPAGEANSASFDIQEFESEMPGSGVASVTILTSGSTGEPKAARHSWEGISRPIRKMNEGAFPVWLLSYRPQLYAGLQVALQCFADQGTLVIPARDQEPDAIVDLMVGTGVQFISATPSYWRRLLMFAGREQLRKVPLRQITLGGEIVDDSVLSRLRSIFPAARLTHIYATTELGRCFSVGDGLAGFPAGYLERPLPDGVELKIADGELVIRSVNAMQMYDPLSGLPPTVGDWFATGDLVEIRDGRVLFVGRKTEMINVAGSKVYPAEVERVIRSIPGVADTRVYGKRSSVAGELVVCDVVPESDVDTEALRQQIISRSRAQLSSPQVPRLVKFVDKIELSVAGKTLRSKSAS